jgi:hypothetical protein
MTTSRILIIDNTATISEAAFKQSIGGLAEYCHEPGFRKMSLRKRNFSRHGKDS